MQELDIILESFSPWTIGPFDAWRAILSQTAVNTGKHKENSNAERHDDTLPILPTVATVVFNENDTNRHFKEQKTT